jgi:hypothetical protein
MREARRHVPYSPAFGGWFEVLSVRERPVGLRLDNGLHGHFDHPAISAHGRQAESAREHASLDQLPHARGGHAPALSQLANGEGALFSTRWSHGYALVTAFRLLAGRVCAIKFKVLNF